MEQDRRRVIASAIYIVGAIHLDTVQMPTATHNDRCLKVPLFKPCEWLVDNWTVSIWTSLP